MINTKDVPKLRTAAKWQAIFDRMTWEQCINARYPYIKKTAWCILTQDVADVVGKFLSQFDHVVEPFAGTGFIAYHLRKASGLTKRQYRAYDPCITHFGKNRPNYGITKSGCFNINIKAADCVVMSWPNYDENLAKRIVDKMVSGQYLIYQGEGSGGCTGCDAFHDILSEHFEELPFPSDSCKYEIHQQWTSIHDNWYFYRKL